MKIHPLNETDVANFRTLRAACKADHLALVSSVRKDNGQPVALLCAMNREGDGFSAVPLAQMLSEDPFETFEDPTDGETVPGPNARG